MRVSPEKQTQKENQTCSVEHRSFLFYFSGQKTSRCSAELFYSAFLGSAKRIAKIDNLNRIYSVSKTCAAVYGNHQRRPPKGQTGLQCEDAALLGPTETSPLHGRLQFSPRFASKLHIPLVFQCVTAIRKDTLMPFTRS